MYMYHIPLNRDMTAWNSIITSLDYNYYIYESNYINFILTVIFRWYYSPRSQRFGINIGLLDIFLLKYTAPK